MAGILKLKPANVQVIYRPSFSPPNYTLVRNDVALAVARQLATAFSLKSTNIAFNQNSTSGQFVSLRYVLPIIPEVQLRYLDALLGVDQAEVIFVNPATILELKAENMKVWKILLDESKPIMSQHYLEAQLHCAIEEGNPAEYLNSIVTLDSGIPPVQKGFSISIREPGINGDARIQLEMSALIPNGIYVSFACGSRSKIENLSAAEKLFDEIIALYRKIQSMAHVQILEPA
jgi:hypothetical protein